MTEAVETILPLSRRAWVSLAIQSPTRSSGCVFHTCAHHPGEATPRPVGGLCQARFRPWGPSGMTFGAIHPFEDGFVLGLWNGFLQRRHVPGPANHSDFSIVFFRFFDFQAHMRFAGGLAQGEFTFVFAQGVHSAGDRFKDGLWAWVFFDDIAPPAFAVRISGGAGQRADGVTLCEEGPVVFGCRRVCVGVCVVAFFFGFFSFFHLSLEFFLFVGKRSTHRQIDKADGTLCSMAQSTAARSGA